MKICRTSERLREIMNERNLKQVDILRIVKPFCDKYNVKMNKSDLSQYVNGKTEPQQEKLFILGLALGVSEGWLMGYDVPRNRMTDAERFAATAEAFNAANPHLPTVREKALISKYRKMNDDNKLKLDVYADNLLKIQTAEDDLLLAAHRERDFDQAAHDHDMEIMERLETDS